MTIPNTVSTIAAKPSTSASKSTRPKQAQPTSTSTGTQGHTTEHMGVTTPPAGEQPAPRAPNKLDQLAALLTCATGATIAEMMAATGWQAHSVRGAMAGALVKTRGLTITSHKVDGVRTYRAGVAAPVDASSETAQ